MRRLVGIEAGSGGLEPPYMWRTTQLLFLTRPRFYHHLHQIGILQKNRACMAQGLCCLPHEVSSWVVASGLSSVRKA